MCLKTRRSVVVISHNKDQEKQETLWQKTLWKLSLWALTTSYDNKYQTFNNCIESKTIANYPGDMLDTCPKLPFLLSRLWKLSTKVTSLIGLSSFSYIVILFISLVLPSLLYLSWQSKHTREEEEGKRRRLYYGDEGEKAVEATTTLLAFSSSFFGRDGRPRRPLWEPLQLCNISWQCLSLSFSTYGQAG